MSKETAYEITPEMRMRLGRTLRRFSRTAKDLMRQLEIGEEEVRIPRKKRKPKAIKKTEETA